MPTYILYYSTQKHVDLCKEAYFIWKDHKQDPQYADVVWVQDLQDDTQMMGKYFHGILPVLKMSAAPFTEYLGADALAQLRLVYSMPPAVAPGLFPATGLDSGPPTAMANAEPLYVPPGLPPNLPPPLSIPPPPPITVVVQPPPMVPRVRAQYALYTIDDPADIRVPSNGLITVQDYDLIATTYGDKLPKWLQDPRALPILATLEKRPTTWFGVAAKHQCELLCLLNGGIMLS